MESFRTPEFSLLHSAVFARTEEEMLSELLASIGQPKFVVFILSINGLVSHVINNW